MIETLPLHQLHKIPFYQDKLVIIVNKKHPLLKTNNLKELENYDYYSREKGSSIYELVQSYFISHKLDIHPSIECVNPSSLIKNKDFYIQRTYHIVMHKDKKLSSIYQEIFELIKNYPK